MEGKSGGRAASPAFSFHRAVRVKDRPDKHNPAPAQMDPHQRAHHRRPKQADHHILHRIRHTVKAGVRGNGILRVVPEEQIDHILHDLPQPRGGHRKQE